MATSAATFPDSRPLVRSGTADSAAAHWSIYSVLFASTSVILGVIWDISWHRSIGRDTFWTPAHLAIYLGGIVAGFTAARFAGDGRSLIVVDPEDTPTRLYRVDLETGRRALLYELAPEDRAGDFAPLIEAVST